MLYREDKKTGNKLSALGLGCMRFPRDAAETKRLVMTAVDGGVNIFDTAYIYPNSEATLGSILAKNGKRKEVYISTKLPFNMCRGAEDFDKRFSEQLKRLQTDYIDYYLVHNMSDYADWDRLRRMGIEQWIDGKKKTGQIRQIGYSFHGTCDEFIKILGAYDWEFCMIQYNYYDENYQAGKTGLLAAADKGMPVMIMEPLLGGTLATGLPKQATDIFHKADPALDPADWALWWLWNQSEVAVVLSGMDSTKIMDSNLRSVDSFRPLQHEELSVYAEVVQHLRNSFKVACTSCNYCLPCPKGINIPGCFSAYNTSYMQGYVKGFTLHVISTAAATKNPKSPRLCNKCGKCELVCPQNLPICKSLKKVAGRFEHLPMRMIIGLARVMLTK